MKEFLFAVITAVVAYVGIAENKRQPPMMTAPPPAVAPAAEVPLKGQPALQAFGWAGPEKAAEAREQIAAPQLMQQCGPEGCRVQLRPREASTPPAPQPQAIPQSFVSGGACSSGSCGTAVRRGLFGRILRR